MDLMSSMRFYTNLLFFRLKSGNPREYHRQWDNYWQTIHKTGADGEVLWDSAPETAAADDLARFGKHFDPDLPVLELGCGNGRQSRFLARHFKKVVGIDVSEAAIALAKRETRPEETNVEFRVGDATHPDEAAALHAELGDMNVYIRTVMHVVQRADRPAFVQGLETLLGRRGTLYQIELSLGALSYFKTLPGSSPSGLPALVHSVVRHGVAPIGFDAQDRRAFYPDERWECLAEGTDAVIHTVVLEHGEEGLVPAYYQLNRPRRDAQPQRVSRPGHEVGPVKATA